MKDFCIKDCATHENQTVTSSFVVVSKQVKTKKNSGEPYIALTFGDRTGHLDAKVWDNVNEIINLFEQDDFVKVKGLLNRYNNRFQFTVHKLRKMEDSEIDYADYLPKTEKNIDALWAELAHFV